MRKVRTVWFMEMVALLRCSGLSLLIAKIDAIAQKPT
jgi:hypothetical protein